MADNEDNITLVYSEEESDISLLNYLRTTIDENLGYIQNLIKKHSFPQFQKDYINQEVVKIKAKQDDNELHMAVIGEFSSGKSTFINALLRENLLETDIVQGTTIASTSIRYNRMKTLTGFNTYDRGTQLVCTEHVVELAKKLQEYTSGIMNDFKTLEVGYPSNFLKQGICIIDTPGTNSIQQWHEDITKTTIREQADACIILISAEKPLPQTFRCFLEENLQDVLSNCIFVVTKIDLIRPKEQKRQLQYIKKKIQDELCLENPLVLSYCSLALINGTGQEYAEDNDRTEMEIIRFLQEQRVRIQLKRCVSLLESTMAYLTESMRNLSFEQKHKHEQLLKAMTTDLATFIRSCQNKYQQVFSDETMLRKQNFGEHLTAISKKRKQMVVDEFKSITDSQKLKSFLNTGLNNQLVQQKDELLNDLGLSDNNAFQEVYDISENCCNQFEKDFHDEYRQLILLTHDLDVSAKLEVSVAVNTQSSLSITQKVTNFDKSENRSILGGAAAGAAIGSVLPGLGTLAGAAIGFVAGLFMMPSIDKLRNQVADDVNGAINQYFSGLENEILQAYNRSVIQGWTQIEELMNRYLLKYTSVVNDMKKKDKQEQSKIEKTLNAIEQDIELTQQKIVQMGHVKCL